MIDKIEKKLNEIRATKERVQAQLNALVGAEQVLEQLIRDNEVVESESNTD